MNNKNNKNNTKSTVRILPAGIPEFAAALGVVVLAIVLGISAKSCKWGSYDNPKVENGILEENSAPEQDTPTQTVLDPIPIENIAYPFKISDSVILGNMYTATGYFPENGKDDAIEDVLAVRVENTSEKTLEYLTFTLNVNGEDYKFMAATVPAGKSVYVFNTEKKIAPGEVRSLEKEVEFEIFFAEEPTTKPDVLSYKIQNGSVLVTNNSGEDIKSDIIVYYKSTANNGYLGGITYRFRISGGLNAGQSFNAYAPHAYSHMTEIMFTQYEK